MKPEPGTTPFGVERRVGGQHQSLIILLPPSKREDVCGNYYKYPVVIHIESTPAIDGFLLWALNYYSTG
ncbi:hypothetical protein LINPERHAP1_LOCUS22722, partial [Linum perenne]